MSKCGLLKIELVDEPVLPVFFMVVLFDDLVSKPFKVSSWHS